jgi:hypothetical protein
MSYHPVLDYIHATALGQFMVNVPVAFSVCETLHFIGLCLLIGSLLIVDLRLMDLMKGIPIRLALKFVPIAIFGLVINKATGLCFYTFNPVGYWTNWMFLVKMGLFVAASANALFFTFVEEKRVLALPEGAPMDRVTRITAAMSLTLWILVLIAGRMLPVTQTEGNG